MVDKDTIKKFSEECSDWLGLKNEEYQDPILMGGVLMKATLELYLSQLSVEDMHHLLDVVKDSVPEVRRQQMERGQFQHQGNKVLH
jgi:hypothetical protein